MLKYEYLRKTENGLMYAYYPEGNADARGEVEVAETGGGRVMVESSEDVGKRYAFHAIKGIDISKKVGTVAWY